MCRCSWTLEEGWDLASFMMYDPLLDSYSGWKDTTCKRRHDALPAGLWMRLVVDSNRVYCQAQKSVLDGVLDGMYIQRRGNRNVWVTEKYAHGWIVDTSYSYFPDGRLSAVTVFLDSCSSLKERIGYSRSGTISYYENSTLEIELYFLKNGTISSICQTKNGVPHGEERFYNRKGKLYLTKQWNDGNIISKDRKIFVRRPYH